MRRLNIAQLLAATVLSLWSAQALAQEYYLEGKRVSRSFAEAMNLVNEAKSDLEENKIQPAVEAAERAVTLAPESALTHGALGATKARSGDLDAAIEELKKAITLNDKKPEFWISLGSVYQAAGHTDKAVETLHEYMKKFPNEPHMGFVKSQVAILERELGNRKGNAGSDDSDYFAETTQRAIVKWDPAQMPISVYIEKDSKATDFKPSYPDLAAQSFQAWESVSNDKIKFKFVEQPNSADIKLRWSANSKDVSQPAEGGEAKVARGPDGIGNVSITILTVLPVKELLVNDALIHYICLHEIGHALGMVGHSSRAGDIMYCSLPMDYEKRTLSDRDAKTLQHLYSDDVHSTKMAAGEIPASADECAADEKARRPYAQGDLDGAIRLYRQALAQYPQSQLLKTNLASILNNSGSAAMNNEKLDTAIALLKEALELNPANKNAKINLGIAYMDSAIMDSLHGQSTEAETLYKKAISLLSTSDNQPSLTMAVQNYARFLNKVGRGSEAESLQAKYLK
jgi:Flp pilus assembly protein TadD/predicted Zn-dependent protease